MAVLAHVVALFVGIPGARLRTGGLASPVTSADSFFRDHGATSARRRLKGVLRKEDISGNPNAAYSAETRMGKPTKAPNWPRWYSEPGHAQVWFDG